MKNYQLMFVDDIVKKLSDHCLLTASQETGLPYSVVHAFAKGKTVNPRYKTVYRLSLWLQGYSFSKKERES